VPEQVCFRCDFPTWLNSLSQRDERVIEDLMLGERPLAERDPDREICGWLQVIARLAAGAEPEAGVPGSGSTNSRGEWPATKEFHLSSSGTVPGNRRGRG
jgi:hypothetical protein